MDERVMLTHPDTGAFFACPVAAVDDWKTLGWQETDERPDEPNPVVAERVAWEAEQAAANEPPEPPDGDAGVKPSNKRRSAASNTEE